MALFILNISKNMKEAIIPISTLYLILFLSIQSNHTGLNINYLSTPMVVNLFFCLKNRKKLAVALTITVLVIILLFNKYNILVNYETWLNRGMPAAFELK